MKSYKKLVYRLLALTFASIFLLSCGEDYTKKLLVIPEYKEMMSVVSEMENFKNFPPVETWRILIDGKRHSEGPFVFDREEPGYLAGLARGLTYALNNVSKTVTVEFLEELRLQSIRGVAKEDDSTFNKELGGNAAKVNLVIGSNATKDGLLEFRQKIKDHPFIQIKEGDDGKPYLYRASAKREDLYPFVSRIVEAYENSSKTIRDMVVMAQDLDQLHPFNDGNIRTFAILLLQKELARMNLRPTIFYNPNIFDGFTAVELETEIAGAQKKFMQFVSR